MSGGATRIDYAALPEHTLVALARAGHRKAFQAIMERCNQRLFRVARAVLRDDSEAEDVLQDAYMRAFAKLDGFREESSLLTWLTQITLNEARGRLRRRRATVALDQLDAAPGAIVINFPQGGAMSDPEAAAAREQARRFLESAVDQLPEAFRLVFIMREIEECTVEETAAQMGLKPETVKTRLHRARRLLRKALHEQLSSTVNGVFPFLGARCERIQARVLERLGLPEA
jgi:RNA polymerase sigma-70 factor (ECF subfamily)